MSLVCHISDKDCNKTIFLFQVPMRWYGLDRVLNRNSNSSSAFYFWQQHLATLLLSTTTFTKEHVWMKQCFCRQFALIIQSVGQTIDLFNKRKCRCLAKQTEHSKKNKFLTFLPRLSDQQQMCLLIKTDWKLEKTYLNMQTTGHFNFQ